MQENGDRSGLDLRRHNLVGCPEPLGEGQFGPVFYLLRDPVDVWVSRQKKRG